MRSPDSEPATKTQNFDALLLALIDAELQADHENTARLGAARAVHVLTLRGSRTSELLRAYGCKESNCGGGERVVYTRVPRTVWNQVLRATGRSTHGG
jgi:hypothetical protein